MKKSKILIALFSAFLVNAQSNKSKDVESIKDMCGCFEVTFNYAETFKYSKDKNYKPTEESHQKALEWSFLLEGSTDDKMQIQHLLIVGPEQKQEVIKHWRQDWLYQNTDLHLYQNGKHWKYIKKTPAEVKGQWTQKVYQVDDTPRYDGTATWVHVDGKHFWESYADAPIPRREHTIRNDYNVTKRKNRHEIIDGGWLHEQDNKKVVRKEGKPDYVLAEEKGYNTYMRVDDSKCKAAQDWWKENHTKWDLIRKNWNEVVDAKKDITLKNTIDNKPIFMHFFELDKNSTNEEVKKVIEKFTK